MTQIRALRDTDDRRHFRSGDADLDRFFARYAGQNQFRHHVGVTYVAVEVERIIGYATVAAATLESDVLPAAIRKRLPAYPLPALRLGRLAVDVSARAGGVGKALLRHTFHLAVDMSERFGCVGVVVDAKSGAVDFYARFGFAPVHLVEGTLESRPRPKAMFLPLELVLSAVHARRG
jgi:predicted N-acetyltransferase YhbS